MADAPLPIPAKPPTPKPAHLVQAQLAARAQQSASAPAPTSAAAAAAAAPPPAQRRGGSAGRLLAACALLVGALGVALAWLWPSGPAAAAAGAGAFHAGSAPAPLLAAASWLLGGNCPQSVRQLRAQLGSALSLGRFGLGAAAPGGAGAGAGGRLPAARDAATGLPSFSLAELAAFDGSAGEDSPLLLGIWGDVFDVRAKGAQFYGPGAPYSVFAGRDGTRALTLGTLDAADVQQLDVNDFTDQFLGMMVEQHKFYAEKCVHRGGGARPPASASERRFTRTVGDLTTASALPPLPASPPPRTPSELAGTARASACCARALRPRSAAPCPRPRPRRRPSRRSQRPPSTLLRMLRLPRRRPRTRRRRRRRRQIRMRRSPRQRGEKVRR